MPEQDREYERTFEEVRADVGARQSNLLWEDAHKNGASVDGFLWKGDPNAKPIQRAGLVVFALAFLLLAILMGSIPFDGPGEEGSIGIFVISGLFLALSVRLFWNAFRRKKKHQGHHPRD
ncbi:MAG: hypothetical protein ACLGSD_18900 [Acidobacteriota bacterium]